MLMKITKGLKQQANFLFWDYRDDSILNGISRGPSKFSSYGCLLFWDHEFQLRLIAKRNEVWTCWARSHLSTRLIMIERDIVHMHAYALSYLCHDTASFPLKTLYCMKCLRCYYFPPEQPLLRTFHQIWLSVSYWYQGAQMQSLFENMIYRT